MNFLSKPKLNRVFQILSFLLLGINFSIVNKAWALPSSRITERRINVSLAVSEKQQEEAKGQLIASLSFPLVKGLKARFDPKKGLLLETADAQIFASAGIGLAMEGDTREQTLARTVEVNNELVEKLNAKLPEFIAAKKYLGIKIYLVAGDAEGEAEIVTEVSALGFKEYATDFLSRIINSELAQGKLQPTQRDVNEFMKAVAPLVLQSLAEQQEDLEAADFDLNKFLEKRMARAQAKKSAPAPKGAPAPQEKATEDEPKPQQKPVNPNLTV